MKTYKFPKQSDYPKIVYIVGVPWSVHFVKYTEDYGETSEEKWIKLKDGLAPRELLATFIHETIHAIEFEAGLKMPHKDVFKWEQAILNLLMDNFL